MICFCTSIENNQDRYINLIAFCKVTWPREMSCSNLVWITRLRPSKIKIFVLTYTFRRDKLQVTKVKSQHAYPIQSADTAKGDSLFSFFMNLFPGTNPISGPLPPSHIGLPGTTFTSAGFMPAGGQFDGDTLSSFRMSSVMLTMHLLGFALKLTKTENRTDKKQAAFSIL